jgi:hypothetical protein
MILTTQVVGQQLLSNYPLVFAPGLLDVFQATTPSVSYFKSIPTYVKKNWAVYLLVLKKRVCQPKIYTVSRTALDRGGSKRLSHYHTKTNPPVYVERALKDSYTIVHKGLPCCCPIQAAGEVLQVRALILAIEATFSIVLWAMKSRIKDYFMLHLSPGTSEIWTMMAAALTLPYWNISQETPRTSILSNSQQRKPK